MSDDAESKVIADRLDLLADGLKQYARIIRGEIQDKTGRGFWRIWCGKLGSAMECKVITAKQYQAFKRLAKDDYERRGGRRSY